MGVILNSKSLQEGKISFEVEVDYVESLQLRGHIKNVHIFSENNMEIKSNISTRGRGSGTKYFLIPIELRNGLKNNSSVLCQKIETKSSQIFVFLVSK